MNDLPAISGIYCITHRVSGRCYVGSSLNIRKRIRRHVAEAMSGSMRYFHRALREFGAEEFTAEILEACGREVLLEHEKFHIEQKQSVVNGFNTRENPCATFDFRPSAATRKRMSDAAKGKKRSEETKRRMADGQRGNKYWLGKKHTDETKAKTSRALKGRTYSPETIARMCAAQRGHPVSDEHRAKVRIAMTGRIVSDETRAKLSAALKGRIISKESIAKRIATERGRINTLIDQILAQRA